MTLEDFVKNFAAQFDETDTSKIKPETKFHELEEWSSMTALAVIAMVDDEYGKTIKGDDLKSSITIEDLFNRVNK